MGNTRSKSDSFLIALDNTLEVTYTQDSKDNTFLTAITAEQTSVNPKQYKEESGISEQGSLGTNLNEERMASAELIQMLNEMKSELMAKIDSNKEEIKTTIGELKQELKRDFTADLQHQKEALQKNIDEVKQSTTKNVTETTLLKFKMESWECKYNKIGQLLQYQEQLLRECKDEIEQISSNRIAHKSYFSEYQDGKQRG